VGPPVEFIEDGPDDAESFVAPDRPPTRRRWLPVLGAVAALGLAAVVARTSGDDSVTSAPPPPTSPGPVVVHLPAGPTPPDDPNGAKVVYLSGCNACARVLRVPVDVGRAVRGVVPGATLSDAYTVISSTTGHLFSRGLVARAGAASLMIEVTHTIEGLEYTASRVVGRVTVAEVQHAGYHVTVRASGLRTPVGRLLRLAASPALIADG